MADILRDLEGDELAQKPYDANDEAQVNEARKKSGKRKLKERDTLRVLMEHENGRALLFESVRCIIEGNPIVAGDPNSTYFNLGQEYRARGLMQEILKIDPQGFAKMIEESMA